ncbi:MULTISPECIES: hypothetical protein [Pseudomonas]|uniref:hypothetical protein n=1 Tax=Pseudomonas TaxID=286 RepID=UPI001C454517|nr:hypothetical protein [Pseudomonas sp. PDM30]MBV7489416.1 hypothetical protein [Pseudomonas sp. PDM30]
MKTIHPDPPYVKPIPHPDNRFMALTSNCTDMPTLSMRGSIECESFILSDFALLCAITLRDGCDVLDVVGRRLRARPSA